MCNLKNLHWKVCGVARLGVGNGNSTGNITGNSTGNSSGNSQSTQTTEQMNETHSPTELVDEIDRSFQSKTMKLLPET